MLYWKSVLFAILSLLVLTFGLGTSATGVCTRTVQSSPSNYTEEYCCSGYSGTPPDCQLMCPNLDDPTNGRVSVDSTSYGGRAYYYCNSGYRLSRYTRRICQSSGTWSGTQPTCIRSCRYLSSLNYGRVSVTTRDVGGTANYSCNSGFELVGPSNRTCLPNGTWTGSQPICNYTLSVLCPSLDNPDNGVVSVSSSYVGESAYYYCNSGYRLSRYTTRTCQLSGEWSGTQPTCIRSCSYLSYPNNGRVFVTTRDVGGTANYSCNSGFELVGPSNRTCLPNGTWTGLQPICNYTLSVFCPSLVDPDNGSVSVSSLYVGGRAYYYCNSGYRQSRYTRRTCQLSGYWSGTQPTCIRTCVYLSNPDYGYVSITTSDVGGRATYSCYSGFELVGPSNRTCLSNGNWTGSQPVCKYTLSVLCPSLSDPDNGFVSVRFPYVGETAYYSCNSGYRLSSYSSRTCQLSGRWSGTQPTCIRSCDYLNSPNYGYVSVTTRDIGGIATYSCNSHFELIGPSSRICLNDGSWSGSQPICNYTLSVACPSLNRPDGGSVSVHSTYVGERAYYYCNYGYELSGNSNRACQLSGNWSGSQPTCIRSCNYLSFPQNGRVSVTTRSVGSNAIYSCNIGFVLSGPSTRTCLSNGTWSGSAPACLNDFQSFSKLLAGSEVILSLFNYLFRLLAGRI